MAVVWLRLLSAMRVQLVRPKAANGQLLAGVREKNCRGNTRHLHPSLELANHFQPGSRWRHEDLFVRLVAA